MYSGYVFGVQELGRALRAAEFRQRAAIAHRHGADFRQAQGPAGWRAWYVCPDQGDAANHATESAVMAESEGVKA